MPERLANIFHALAFMFNSYLLQVVGLKKRLRFYIIVFDKPADLTSCFSPRLAVETICQGWLASPVLDSDPCAPAAICQRWLR